MKNLTLKMSDIASLKKPADAVNKGNAGVDNAAESNSSFQMMLNKQVQAKHAAVKEAQPQNQKKLANGAGEVSPVATKTQMTDVDQAKINVQKANQLRLAMAAKDSVKNDDALQITLAVNESSGLDEKALLSNVDDSKVKAKAEEELPSKADNSDITSNTLVNANGGLVQPAAPVEAKLCEFSSLSNKQDLSSNLSATDKQRSLGSDIKDNVLNTALTQNKLASQADNQDNTSTDDKQSHSNWLAAMLPNAKSSSAEDISNGKLTFSTIQEAVSKESDVKVATMPANFLSTVQTNTSGAIPVAGSGSAINAYPGKAGWDQAISQKVVWMLGAQEQSATLTLNPPELGPLQVVIHVHNDKADTTFISDNAEVRQVLQDGMANLRDKMNESGIQLGQANVNSGGQMQEQFQQAMQQNKTVTNQNESSTSPQTEAVITSQHAIRETNGLVDTFA